MIDFARAVHGSEAAPRGIVREAGLGLDTRQHRRAFSVHRRKCCDEPFISIDELNRV
jgi:hypothetical protein